MGSARAPTIYVGSDFVEDVVDVRYVLGLKIPFFTLVWIRWVFWILEYELVLGRDVLEKISED